MAPGRGSFVSRRSKLCWKYSEGSFDKSTEQKEISVGENLRRLREARGITLRELAERSHLAINTLSLIENEHTSPSVSTLQQLARALEVPVTAFFEGDSAPRAVAYVRSDSRPRASIDNGVLEDLGAGANIREVEPFLVTMDPGASSGGSDIVHTGYEFVFCLSGRILYMIDHVSYLLDPGDSLLFEAHLPHRWQNMSLTPARTLMVLYPTDARDDPTALHFSGE